MSEQNIRRVGALISFLSIILIVCGVLAVVVFRFGSQDTNLTVEHSYISLRACTHEIKLCAQVIVNYSYQSMGRQYFCQRKEGPLQSLTQAQSLKDMIDRPSAIHPPTAVISFWSPDQCPKHLNHGTFNGVDDAYQLEWMIFLGSFIMPCFILLILHQIDKQVELAVLKYHQNQDTICVADQSGQEFALLKLDYVADSGSDSESEIDIVIV